MSLANAIIHDRPDLVEQYLKMGAPVNEPDEYGYTPLIETAIVNNTAMTKLLLDNGADPNGQDMAYGTALHWAVENNNIEMASLLLEHGANPNAYTTASESCMVKPLLRRNVQLKNLLVEKGGSIQFAQDFINTKLLGHRFDLVGAVDIVDTAGKFTEVDLEGFFLEFSLDVIVNSLNDFRQNYGAKQWRHQFLALNIVMHAMAVAAELIRYQHYQMKVEDHAPYLKSLLMQDLQIIPIGYEGHAVTIVKYKDMMTLCNRRKVNEFSDQLLINRMGRPDRFNFDLIKRCVYTKSSAEFIETKLASELQLEPISRLMIKRQITGNCSWANVEAAIPVALCYLMQDWEHATPTVISRQHEAITTYRAWETWDKDRALSFCMQSFEKDTDARKASKASLLAAILFQRCGVVYNKDVQRAKKIMKLLRTPGYEYIIDNYIETYQNYKNTAAGKNFMRMLALEDDPFA
jgi:hypothetical protein